MKMFMRDKERKRAGFTLAELLIVVAIIAILVAIMIPVFVGARANAILSKDTANVRAAYAEEIVDEMTSTSYDDSGSLAITVDATKLGIDKTTHVSLVDRDSNSMGRISVQTQRANNGNADGKNDTNYIKVDPDVSITLIDEHNKSYKYNGAGHATSVSLPTEP